MRFQRSLFFALFVTANFVGTAFAECTKVPFVISGQPVPACIEKFIVAQSQAMLNRLTEPSHAYRKSHYYGSFVGFAIMNLDSSSKAEFLSLYEAEAKKAIAGDASHSGGVIVNPFVAIGDNVVLKQKLEAILVVYNYLHFDIISGATTLNEWQKKALARSDLIENQFVISNSGLSLLLND